MCNDPDCDTVAYLMVRYRSLVSRVINDAEINGNVGVLRQMHVLAGGNRRGILAGKLQGCLYAFNASRSTKPGMVSRICQVILIGAEP